MEACCVDAFLQEILRLLLSFKRRNCTLHTPVTTYHMWTKRRASCSPGSFNMTAAHLFLTLAIYVKILHQALISRLKLDPWSIFLRIRFVIQWAPLQEAFEL